jgi:urease accessory protein
MEKDSDPRSSESFSSELAELRLLHLADSALPIGALAHSFGIESLVAHEMLCVGDLPRFFGAYLEEGGAMEAVFCREGFRLGPADGGAFAMERWRELNRLLSALQPAREARAGSATLGHNFLAAVNALGKFSSIEEIITGFRRSPARDRDPIHHAPAFGLASSVLHLDENRAVLAYLHQSVTGLVSACQRLLPLGQSEATRILWNLKPAMIETARKSATQTLEDVCSFMPLLDWGAMEHPALTTRLFVS